MFSIVPYILFGLSLGLFSTLCTSNIRSDRRIKLTWINALVFVCSLIIMQMLGHDGYPKKVLADFVLSSALSGLFIGTSLFNFSGSQLKKHRA